jgi:Na+/proline symporter
VAQSVIMVVGPVLAFVLIIGGVKGGFAEFLQIGVDDSKFRLFNFSPDLTTATFWVFAIWSLTQFTQVLGQESMQRAWSTEGIKAAKRSVYTLAAVSLPGTVLFYATGTALYAYFCQHPGELNPLQPTDRVFPQYIVQTLPAGLSGLMIAAIIAAAISMAMNTSATAATRDYFRFFNPTASDATQQRFAWWGTLISGVIATAMAILLSTLESKSLWDLFSKLMSLVGGGFGGVIVLGLMTRRASTAGVWTGAIIASVVPPFLEFCTPIHWQTYGSLALVVCFAIGYAVSLIFPDAPRNLEGLTVWTPPKAAKVDG